MRDAVPYDQRWHNGVEVRRTPGERIRVEEFGVEIIGQRTAKPFVCANHYAGSYPASHLDIGLFRKDGVGRSRLVGVAVFSEGVRSQAAMPKWTGFGRDRGTELGRLVLLPEVAYNGETWFVARAFEILRQVTMSDPATGVSVPRFRTVLSYSDPVERRDASGAMVKPGHFGTIYQASNAFYVGRATPRTLHVGEDGRVVHAYAFDKVSNGLRNAAAAERSIQASGAPARGPGEEPAAWVARVKKSMRTIRHPGNLTYVFGLDAGAKRAIRDLHAGGMPYMKADRHVIAA